MQCEEESEENGDAMDVDSVEVRHAKALEVDAVREAEKGRLQAALDLLTEAISVAPHYPSPYNNRAQVSPRVPPYRVVWEGVWLEKAWVC